LRSPHGHHQLLSAPVGLNGEFTTRLSLSMSLG
jgi:hypothetical protein